MIILILLLSLILRLIALNQSLWLDEAISANAARQLGFWQYVTSYPLGDFHPPGYFAILWVWSHLFGFSEIALRMPSVIFGSLTVFLTYLLGKGLFNRKIGLLASFFLAIGPLHIYYSQEARMYSFSAFAATLASFCLFKLLRGGKLFYIFYPLSLGLVLYSDYLAYFYILSHLTYVFWQERHQFKKFIFSLISTIALIIPWFLVLPEQLNNGRQTAENIPGWAKIVGGANLKNLALVGVKSVIGRVSLEDKTLYAFIMLPISIFYIWLMSQTLKQFKKETKFLLCLLVIPVLMAFVISFMIPVLSYFRMIFILPAFYILVALGVSLLKPLYRRCTITLICAISIICVLLYYFNPKFQREDWLGLVNFLNSQNLNNTLVIFEDGNKPAPFIYYDRQEILSVGGIKNFPAKSAEDIIDLNVLTKKQDTIFLVDYLVEISDPKRLIDQKLSQLNWVVVDVHNFNGVGLVYEYSRSY